MNNSTTNKDNAPALFHELLAKQSKTKGYTYLKKGVLYHAPQVSPHNKERNLLPLGSEKVGLESSNYIEKPRHYPPANKE